MKDWRLGEIPEGKGTWTVELEHDEQGRVLRARFVLDNPTKNMRRKVELGWVDDGNGNAYDTICCEEEGGGGVVSMLYTIVRDKLYVGVVTQYRTHMGGDVENAPRGYLKVGSSDRATNALEETAEEVGPRVAEIGTPRQLPGRPVSMNSAVFWTPGPNEGNSFHAIRVPERLLEFADEDGSLRFKQDYVNPQQGESITCFRLIPWTEAVLGRDGLTIVGVARLMAYLSSIGKIRMHT